MTCSFTVQRDGDPVEVEITAKVHGPEHDVGIMAPYAEDLDGKSIELTEEEERQVNEKLAKMYFEDPFDE